MTTPLSELPAIAAGIAHLTSTDPDFAAVMDRFGPLRFTLKPGGFAGLVRIILGQQVSVASAEAIWLKLAAGFDPFTPQVLAPATDEQMRALGLSRQKSRYIRELAKDILEGRLDLAALNGDDEPAIAQITSCVGLGRWTAENYLLFCEGRPDLFPAKDLAILIGLEWLKAMPGRPTPIEGWTYATRWRPHRSAATLMIWHHYMGVISEKRLSR